MKWLAEQNPNNQVQVAEPKTEVVPPPMYQVVLLNDDYTPMDFVVEILQYFFHMEREKAVQVMLQVHYQGKGECGVFSRDVAETKVYQVNDFANQSEQPLHCTMETV